MSKIQLRYDKITLIYKKINLKIFKSLLNIFPFLTIRINGFITLLLIKKKYIILYLNILKYNSSFMFNFLVDIAVTDYPWKKNRFYINYIIRSLTYSKVIYIYIKTPSYRSVYSLTDLFNSCLWIERECWDLFGIFFLGHKNIKRLLTDYGFQGHPLLKCFPLKGFLELIFLLINNSLTYQPIKS